ncbi:RNA polymerase sigma-70 factor, ECF subfamily [Segatella oulorum]|uniref:RNA polymerase sigma-70 factor, ECF subfamily n=2 Tax=Segatella oulorum TaxID=28136 RepID=A0A1T4NQT4_9BACT|nr:RNA polymerase sigma-70 factor, ECF subfamily [Segatella oulorum]
MNLNSLTDEELALRYVAGNNRAFDELLRRNQSQLFTYILFVVRDRHVADDVFQETFVRAISKLQNNAYRANGKFGAWLTRIAHNVMIDLFRSQKNKNVISIEDDTLTQLSARALLANNIEAECINAQVLTDVKRMVDLLPPVQREVVFMRFYQQMPFKEIAERTNVSINTSLGRLHYAIRNLRKMARIYNISLQLA